MLTSCGDPAEKAQKELMEKGVIHSVLDVKGPAGDLALLQAMSQQNGEIVQLLLTAGIDVNTRLLDSRSTPLLLSIRKDDAELIKLFMAADADPNIGNEEGETPLSLAAFKGKTELVDKLLHAGAAAQPEGKKLWSPLMAACSKSGKLYKLSLSEPSEVPVFAKVAAAQEPKAQREIVEKLIKAGADVNFCHQEWPQWSPLAIAAAEGRPKMVKQLLAAGATTEPKEDKAITALTAAAMSGQTAIAELLIQHGANVNAPCSCGVSPLYAALRKGNTELVTLLCKNGAKLPDMSDIERSLLSHALSDKPEMLNVLRKHGIAVSTKDVLQEAIRRHDAAAVGKLLECGADMTERDEDGSDALCYAVKVYCSGMSQYTNHRPANAGEQEKMLNTMRVLLQHHADVNTANAVGESVLSILLNESLMSPEHTAAAAELLLQAGAELPRCNKQGEPILFNAFSILRKEDSGVLATLLIRHGANPNLAAKKGGDTPLHQAISHGCRHVAIALIEGGADVNQKAGAQQFSPLFLAVKMARDADIAKALIEHGADVNERLGEYLTLYDVCSGEMQRLLKAHGAHGGR